MANNYSIQFNWNNIDRIVEAQAKAVLGTANSIILDVNAANTVPFDTSALENSVFLDQEQDGNVDLVYSTPYAARQYFDASLDHSKGGHAGTATDHWLEPYLEHGTKEQWVKEKFAKHLAKELRRL